MVTIIVAYDEARVIGNKGGIPWRFTEDFKHFKRTTTGNPCIMGRKTWDSLPVNYKPLPDRPNIVVTRNSVQLENDCFSENVFFEESLEEAVDFAIVAYPYKEIFIIGGSQIYQQALEKKLVDRVLASEVKGVHEGDTFFPELPLDGMELVKSRKIIQEFDDFSIVEYAL